MKEETTGMPLVYRPICMHLLARHSSVNRCCSYVIRAVSYEGKNVVPYFVYGYLPNPPCTWLGQRFQNGFHVLGPTEESTGIFPAIASRRG